MPSNKGFINVNNQMVIRKSKEKNEEYDTLIFVRRDATKVIIPSFIKQIGSYAFSECPIETISIPSSVTEICEDAFYKCTQLKNVEILPDSKLKKIQKNAFSQTSLTNINLPSTVTELEEDWKDEDIQLNKMQEVGQEVHENLRYSEDPNHISQIKFKADQGNPQAMLEYAKMLKDGVGIKEDKSEAAKYFKLAAEQGDIESIFNYAVM